MTTMKKLKKSKEHREAFVSSQIEIGIPFQIRALRKQHDMDQKELAKLTGMAQPRISAIESPGYRGYSIETLSRVAAAFDVALIVRFGPFSELIKNSGEFSPDNFEVPSFEDDYSACGMDAIAMGSTVISTTNLAKYFSSVQMPLERRAEQRYKDMEGTGYGYDTSEKPLALTH